MAATGDSRSLLRAARAARRVNHPQAAYTKAGTLTCRICGLAIKSDTLWEAHVRSVEHGTKLKAAKEARTTLPHRSDKKRKADQEDDDSETERKRQKEDETVEQDDPETDPTPKENSSRQDPVDADEWAAFERDIADAEREVEGDQNAEDLPAKSRIAALNAPSAYEAHATTTSKDMNGDQVAEATRRTGRQTEEELNAEREEAARQLEEEFDEMEGLEARVRKLKERREGLRGVQHAPREAEDKPLEDKTASEDEDEDDDDDEFGFGGRWN